jgi:hypothetical protein
VDSLDLVTTPGTYFQYGPSHYYAFGVLLERKLHNANCMINPLQYLQSEIFDSIGFQYQTWVHDSAGNPHIPNGCYATARNWAKYGQFMVQKGRWGTSQIIDSNLVEDMYVATGPNPGHGYFCWLNNTGGQGAVPTQSAPPGSPGGFIYYNGFTEIIGGLGAGKNRMYLIPSLNAVVLRQTLMDDDTFSDHVFLSYLLNSLLTSVNFVSQESDGFALSQNYPNPFNPTTTISWRSPVSGYQSLKVYDVLGNEIASLVHEIKPAGSYEIEFDGSKLSSGVYFYQLKASEFIETKKLTLVK